MTQFTGLPVNRSGKRCIASLLVAFLASFSVSLFAFENDFPPYAKGQFPTVCSIHLIKPTTETDRNKGNFKSSYVLTDKKRKVSLNLKMSYQKAHPGLFARLIDKASNKVFIPSVKIGGHPSNIGSVYWAYLNKDNQKDWIISMDEGDGYLSSGRQTVTFLLSTSSGYSAKQIGAYHLEQKDFYDFSTDHKCEYLHQSFVSDGMDFYWAYNILQFIDNKIVIKNKLSRYFPKWIKMPAKGGSSQAARLSNKQQHLLSRKYLKQVGSVVSSLK